MALFGVLTLPMRVLGYLLEELPRAVVSVERLDGVVDAPAAPAPEPGTARALPEGGLGIEVEGVAFAYPGAEPVLHDVTLSVAPGQVVAVTGATGSGKSTLCNLLAGLAEPTEGRVVLGGVDLAMVDPSVVHAAVAYVFQDTFLFADSVAANLTMGTDATAGEVERAVRVALADRFVAALPESTDTIIGERGITLSGGQRQRLALARALVRRPRLLVLDDATSAVDPRVEQQILHRLRSELDTTTVVVAHRVSTIALADRVAFLDGGRVAATGTHAQLLATVPAYEALVRAYEQQLEAPDEDDDHGGVLTGADADGDRT